MSKIFKNLIPYWKGIIVITLLLVIQAYGDLSLPQYTSDIIDVGIQNRGVEYILPERITEDEFAEASIFMTDAEKNAWESSYTKDGQIYSLSLENEKEIKKVEGKLLNSIVLTYQLGHMSEDDFKDTVSKTMSNDPSTVGMADQIDEMSISDIEKLFNMDIYTFEAEDENGVEQIYVDMRPLMEELIESGRISSSMIEDSRNQMEATVKTIGDDTLRSMGVAYSISCEKAAGIDIESKQMKYLWTEGARMFAMAAIMLVAAVIVSLFAAKIAAGIGRDLRGNVFRNVVGFSNAEMDQFSTASLITRSTNDVQQIQMVTAFMLRMLLYAPILGIGGVYKVATTGANMSWVVGLALLVIAGFVAVLMAISMPKFKLMQKLVDNLNLVSREILTGLSVIRAFGREKTEEERFDEANVKLTKTQLFTNRVMTFMMPGMMLIMYCLVIGITWVAAHRIDDGNLQVGAMTAFITYAMLIVMAFLMLTVMSIFLPRAGVAADRIDEVIKTHSSVENIANPVEIEEYKGVVRFNHVSFKYPGAAANVIEDIDFVAEPGKVTAVIGSTGSGKSTLVNLIPRFYDVTEGEITVDGVDIRNIDMKKLRAQVGFVPQKGVLFSGTIGSNLRFGNKDATDEDVMAASEIAQASDFIKEKSEGLESDISQGGSNVSGGQKQRLAIARAIAKKPKIFVFDDSFSALDMKTDAKLRRSLSERVSDATEIIVAQRISTIIHADQILVIDEGRIVGKGTHEELLKSCVVYQQIATSQLSAKELESMDNSVLKGGVFSE